MSQLSCPPSASSTLSSALRVPLSSPHFFFFFALPYVPLATVKKAMLKAANVAHFDALGHDFDKHHPDTADFADQLSHVLCCVLVLNAEATSVLDHTCGSGKLVFAAALLLLA